MGLLTKDFLRILIPRLSSVKSVRGWGQGDDTIFFCASNLIVGSHSSGSVVLKFERLSKLPEGFVGHRFLGCTPKASGSAGLGET